MSEQPQESLASFLTDWLWIGLQSFGGGVATLTLIRHVSVEKRRWLSDADFTRYWSLVQMAPGINLLGLTILLGRRAHGWSGVGASVLGLLAPSVTITAALTAVYVRFEGSPAVAAALRGVVPATVGLGILTAIQMGRPLLAESRRLGIVWFALAVCVLLASAAALLRWAQAVVPILLLSGGVGAASGVLAQRTNPVPETGAE